MDAVGTGGVGFHTPHPNLVCVGEILIRVLSTEALSGVTEYLAHLEIVIFWLQCCRAFSDADFLLIKYSHKFYRYLLYCFERKQSWQAFQLLI